MLEDHPRTCHWELGVKERESKGKWGQEARPWEFQNESDCYQKNHVFWIQTNLITFQALESFWYFQTHSLPIGLNARIISLLNVCQRRKCFKRPIMQCPLCTQLNTWYFIVKTYIYAPYSHWLNFCIPQLWTAGLDLSCEEPKQKPQY